MRHFVLLWPLLAACSSSPTPTIALPNNNPTPSDTSAPTEPPVINVAVASAPSGFSLDGDTSEWSLRAPPGTSKLAVAITNETVVVATELGHPSPDGFWLGIASVAPAMLPLATWEAGGNSEPIDCMAPGHMEPKGIWSKDEIDLSRDEPPQNKPEDVEACNELIARHEQRQAAHRKRFTRLLRIEATRVQFVNEKGDLVAIESAKIAWKPRSGGVTAEISLPRSALPRLSEAPLARLFVWAGPANTSPPEGPPEDEAKALNLPAPVSFEPLAKLRARVFKGVQPPIYIANSREEAQYPWAGMSYDLVDPLRIEWIHFGRSAQTVKVESELLYEKKATLGDIEVGHVRGLREWLAISKKGAIIDWVELPESLRTVIVRDGEIHAISYTPPHYTMAYSSAAPSWNVIAVGPDGIRRNAAEDLVLEALAPVKKGGLGCAQMGPLGVMNGVETASASFDTFGWKGSCSLASGGAEAAFEMTWKWDAAKKQYTGTFNKLSSSRRKK